MGKDPAPDEAEYDQGGASRPLILELVGLPGAGKTTVLRSVVPLLEERGYRCGTRESLFRVWKQDPSLRRRILLVLCRREPRVVRAAVRYLLQIRPWRFGRKKYFSVLLFTAYALRRFLETDPADHDVVILDHSVLQAAFSAAVYGRLPSGRRLTDLLQALYGDTRASLGFVYLEVDAATSSARIAGRSEGWSRFDSMSPEEAQRVLAENQAQHRHLFSAALAGTGAPAIQLDARRSVHEIAAEVVSFVELHRAEHP